MSGPVSAKRTLLVMGDSLSAAYNLPAEQGWVALIAKRMKTTHPDWTVANASISGETTSGGLSRMPAALKQHKPKLVIIELGANDALRGLPLELSRRNLQSMIRLAKAADAKVLLIGMQMPPTTAKPTPTASPIITAIWPNRKKPRCCRSCCSRSRSTARTSCPIRCTRMRKGRSRSATTCGRR
jgi:lysophospholipase L1-like esterase